MQHFGKVPLLLLEHGPVHQRVPLPTAVGGPRSNLRAVEGSELHLYPIQLKDRAKQSQDYRVCCRSATPKEKEIFRSLRTSSQITRKAARSGAAPKTTKEDKKGTLTPSRTVRAAQQHAGSETRRMAHLRRLPLAPRSPESVKWIRRTYGPGLMVAK